MSAHQFTAVYQAGFRRSFYRFQTYLWIYWSYLKFKTTRSYSCLISSCKICWDLYWVQIAILVLADDCSAIETFCIVKELFVMLWTTTPKSNVINTKYRFSSLFAQLWAANVWTFHWRTDWNKDTITMIMKVKKQEIRRKRSTK